MPLDMARPYSARIDGERRIFYYMDEPGVFRYWRDEPADDDAAREAGFDIEACRAEADRQRALAAMREEIDAAYATRLEKLEAGRIVGDPPSPSPEPEPDPPGADPEPEPEPEPAEAPAVDAPEPMGAAPQVKVERRRGNVGEDRRYRVVDVLTGEVHANGIPKADAERIAAEFN